MSDVERPKGVTVADGECRMCGHAVMVKATNSKNGFLCYTCPAPADGGCGHQTFSRSRKADALIVDQVVKKWRKPEYRAAYLVAEDDRAPADVVGPTTPGPDPSDDPGEDRDAKIDRELFGE